MKHPLIPAEHLAILVGICAALHVGKLPPALPVLSDAFGLTLVQSGLLLALVQLAAMAAGIFVRLAADGLGLRRSMLGGLAILTVASMLGGFATEAWQLMSLRAMEGFGFLATVLPVPRLLRLLVPPERLRRTLGLWGAFTPAGTALALLIGPWVMAWIGWQGWWWGLAALSAGMLAWTATAIPRDARLHRAAASGLEWIAPLRITLSSPGPWLTSLTFGVYALQWMSVIGFLPTIYAHAGIAATAAGAMTAVVAAVNALGNIVSGRLLHRGVRPERILVAAFVTMTVCAFVTFGEAESTPLAVRFAAVVLLTGVGGLIPGALFPLAVDLAPEPGTVSTAVGFMQQLSGAGQFVGPLLVAWVAWRAGGWQLTWVVTGGASVVGIALALAIGRVHARQTRDA